MKDTENTAAVKSKAFALRIVKLYRYLCDEKQEYILSKQLLRSGTSIGANLAEAEFAVSRNDFSSKVYIALKECGETVYWLDLLRDSEYLTASEYESIANDARELLRILQASTKTLKSKETPQRSGGVSS